MSEDPVLGTISLKVKGIENSDSEKEDEQKGRDKTEKDKGMKGLSHSPC